MAVSLTSRYRSLQAQPAPDAAGVPRPAIPARLPPGPSSDSTPYLHTVVAGETIETLAYRYLGSSEAWWEIADANPGVFPTELQPGTVVVIPTGANPGLVVRTRSF